MKADELLEQQHRAVEGLFERFEQSEDDEKLAIFEELAANLVAHDAIEREIFYPACDKDLGEEDVLGESLVEHGLVEFSLFRADANKKHHEFDQYVTVLKEVVMHHVKEEERELLPKARRRLEHERLEALGAKMEERFEQALAADFRRPLRANLQQVLNGATRTKPKPAARTKSRPKVKAKKRSARAA